MKYTYDQPKSQGVANVLKRAEEYANVEWMPIKAMPKTVSCDVCNIPEKIVPGHFPAWRPEKGLPYSSARFEEKYIGTDLFLPTFFSALANPKSVLYTRDLTGKGPRMSSWFGIVCSGYASYCLQLPQRRPTALWDAYPDMEYIPLTSAQDVQLGDSMCSHKAAHVVMITAIKRDETGKVVAVTVSESILPLVAVTEFPAKAFEKTWIPQGYNIYRRKNFEEVTYTPSRFVHVSGDPKVAPYVPNPTVLLDYGDEANYKRGDNVELNVMEAGWDSLVIVNGEGKEVYRQTIFGPQVYTFRAGERGYYTAYCKKGNKKSRALHFYVAAYDIIPEQEGDILTVKLDAGEGQEKVDLEVRDANGKVERIILLTEEQKKSGLVKVEGLSAGAYKLRSVAKNAWGQYSFSVKAEMKEI